MIKLKYTFTCTECGIEESVEIQVFYGWDIQRPEIPKGWTEAKITESDGAVFGLKFLCPKHEAKIKVQKLKNRRVPYER